MASRILNGSAYAESMASEAERKAIGRLIAKRRNELGLSQRALGELAGVSRVMIYAIESGATHVPWKRAPAPAKALGLTQDDILRPEDRDEGWVQFWGMFESLPPDQRQIVIDLMKSLNQPRGSLPGSTGSRP